MFSINNNSSAQSILSNLNWVENQMNSSYQQLSTGNRVNSAADDPAAYAISQQMTSQINGLNQATQNSQNGISMIQTATGAMNQVEQVLQTMSTLATEAANAGSTFSDRANLQLEMNALSQQINSTTNQTQYNGINLLSGQYGNNGAVGQSALTLQIGANQGQVLNYNIGATDVNTLGVAGTQATGITGYTASLGSATGSGVNGAAVTQNISTGATLSSGSLLQAGMNLQVALTANLSAATGSVLSAVTSAVSTVVGSATTPSSTVTAMATQIAQDYNTANGTSTATSSTTTAGALTNASVVAGKIATAITNYFNSNQSASAFSSFYNGVLNAFGAGTYANGTTTTGGNVNSTALNTSLNDLFQNNSSSHAFSGVTFTNTSIQSTTNSTTGISLNNDATAAVTGITTAQSPSASLVTYVAQKFSAQLQSSSPSAYNQLVAPTNAQNFDAVTAYYTGTSSQLTQGSVSLQLQTNDGSLIGGAQTVTNLNSPSTTTLGDTATGATLSLSLNTLSSLFTISTGAVSGTYTQTDSFTTTGKATSAGTQANGWQADGNVTGINILTQSGAQSAITAIQGAINNLSSSQAQLGAVQDRLNYTVSNLGNSAQNLQNAQSTITNTNMAAEYTQFSQQQVLSQVGISMLSQAQQQPGMILKLLQ